MNIQKFFLSFFFLFVVSFSSAQDTLLFQNFQQQNLGTFQTVDVDMEFLASEFVGLIGSYNIVPVSGPADFRALAVSTFLDATAQADNWLISPLISIPATGTALHWKASSLSAEADRLEDYRVMISEEGGSATEEFTIIAFEQLGENPTQTERSLDLSAYVGRDIRFAFNQIGVDNFALTIDDILVTTPSSTTSADLVTMVGERYQDLNNRSLELEIFNSGSDVITSLTVAGDINGQAGETVFDNLDIRPQETVLITFADLFPFAADRYDITAVITEINGIAVDGQSLSRRFFMVENPPLKTFVYEEATSTSCGWCPEGIVWKGIMELKYTDEIINISSHSDDPMVNIPYDLGLQNQVGFMGFPSAFVGRERHLSHPEVEPYFLEEFSRIAPMSMELDYSYNEETRALDIVVSSNAHTALSPETHRYSVMILEDNITGESADFAQANNFSFEVANIDLSGVDGVNWSELPNPVPAFNSVYNDVVRELFGAYDGIINSIADRNVGENNTHEINYILPSFFDEQEITLVALALDIETGEIVHAVEGQLDLNSRTQETYNPISNLNVYPNPAISETNIDLVSTESTEIQIELANSLGNSVMTKKYRIIVGSNRLILPVNELPEGMYQIIVRNDKALIAKPLVIIKQ